MAKTYEEAGNVSNVKLGPELKEWAKGYAADAEMGIATLLRDTLELRRAASILGLWPEIEAQIRLADAKSKAKAARP